MKYILFVNRHYIVEEIVQQIGASSVAAVCNFESLENSPSDFVPRTLPLQGLEKFSGGGWKP